MDVIQRYTPLTERLWAASAAVPRSVAALILASLVLSTVGQAAHVTAHLTADNAYVLCAGQLDGTGLRQIGAGSDWGQLNTWEFSTSPGEYVFAVAWNAETYGGAPRMYLGELLWNGRMLLSTTNDWVVAVSRAPNPVIPGVSSPPLQELAAEIRSAVWLQPMAYLPNGSGPWGQFPLVGGSGFIWYDAFWGTLETDVHYLIFRSREALEPGITDGLGPPFRLEHQNDWKPEGEGRVESVQCLDDRTLASVSDGRLHVLRRQGVEPAAEIAAFRPDVRFCDGDLDGSVAWVASFQTNFLSTVEAWDLADPLRPRRLGYWDTPGEAQGIKVVGHYAYVADGEAGLMVLDIGMPSNLVEVGRVTTQSAARKLEVRLPFVYLMTDAGLLIFDVSNPSSPTRAGAYKADGKLRDFALSGSHVFLLDEVKGLCVLNVTQPRSPLCTGQLPWTSYGTAIAVANNYLFLAGGYRGLDVIDVSDPAKPEWVAGTGVGGSAEDVAVSGSRVWVAAGAQGLLGFEFLDRRIKLDRQAGPGNALTFSWQADAGWQLQRTTNLMEANWQTVPSSETTNRITVPTGVGSGFFRLVKP